MAALSSFHHLSTSLSLLTKPSLSLPPFLRPIRSLPPITSFSFAIQHHICSSKPQTQPPPNLKNDALLDSESSPLPPNGQFFIPWIVRGEDGNLKLQAHPPARLIHSLADAKTQKPKKKVDKAVKKKKEILAVGNASVEPPPKLSKAARRFYNENFREPPQRLSKVLAASGVASRRGSEELIFGGKVTANGSVCSAPRLELILQRILFMSTGTAFLKDCHQRCILP